MLTTMMIAASVLAGIGAMALTEKAPEETKAAAPTTYRLWEGEAPGALGTADEDIPSITVYAPPAEKANGAAVVVCPGGGYGGRAEHEKGPPAEWLVSNGVTAITLKYRLGPRYHHPVELGDASRALRFARAHAAEWKLDPHRIGILGFSAGGHLASSAATHFDDGDPNAADPINRVSSRPDIAILLYPVITLTDPFTHSGSRQNLLGEHPAPELVELLSNEKQVTAKTPPTFLVHSVEDKAVPVENSLLFAAALRKAGVPFELHIFEAGPHGFGMGGSDPVLSAWPRQCAEWMRKRGFFGPSK